MNRIKEYIEYKRQKRIAKRELCKIAATILPVIREMSNKGADIIKFVARLTNETKNVNGEKLIEMVLNEVSATLQTDQNRIVEILSYIADLNPSEIQEILVHSMVETMPEEAKN